MPLQFPHSTARILPVMWSWSRQGTTCAKSIPQSRHTPPCSFANLSRKMGMSLALSLTIFFPLE